MLFLTQKYLHSTRTNPPMRRIKYIIRDKEPRNCTKQSIPMKKNKRARKGKFQDIDNKICDYLDARKTKMIVDFNDRESASIKSFAVKKKNEIKVNLRFISGKLLMFAQPSLKSFTYSLWETLHFPDPKVKEMFEKYQIEKILCYHVLIDTDSTSLQFIIISDPYSDFPDSKIRDVLFEVITRTDIYKRFDPSHPFWGNFNARKRKK